MALPRTVQDLLRQGHLDGKTTTWNPATGGYDVTPNNTSGLPTPPTTSNPNQRPGVPTPEEHQTPPSTSTPNQRPQTPTPEEYQTPPSTSDPNQRPQSPVPRTPKAGLPYEQDSSTPHVEDNFGHDPIYEEGMNQIKEQLAQMRAEQERQNRLLDEQQKRAQEQLGRWRDDSLTANTENMADRGLVHSGINVKQQADIGEDFLRNNEELNHMSAQARGELERHFAGQRQQLQAMENQLTQERAAREAAERKERDLNEAINATPEPTVTGRYSLDHILISNQARKNVSQDKTGADNAFMENPTLIGERVEAIFDNNDVPMASRNETDAQRLERIVNEIATGQRTFNDVRDSVRRIAGMSNTGPHSNVQIFPYLMDTQDISGRDSYYMQSPQLLAERTQEIFNNRGVDIATPQETELERLNRIIQEVASGKRSLNDVRQSVDRIAASQ